MMPYPLFRLRVEAAAIKQLLAVEAIALANATEESSRIRLTQLREQGKVYG